MKGFLLKDFYSTKRVILFMTLVPVMLAVVAYTGFLDDGQETNGFIGFVMIIPVIVTAIFAVSVMMNTLVYDETSNYLLYALTTPVNKKMYLRSKYAFLGVTTGINVLISGLSMLIVLIAVGSVRTELLLMLLGAMILGILFSFLLGTCLMALSMKYTAVKASQHVAIFYVLFGASGIILGNLSEEMKTFIKGNIVWMVIALLVILGIFAVMLFRKSGQWLEQKEF